MANCQAPHKHIGEFKKLVAAHKRAYDRAQETLMRRLTNQPKVREAGFIPPTEINVLSIARRLAAKPEGHSFYCYIDAESSRVSLVSADYVADLQSSGESLCNLTEAVPGPVVFATSKSEALRHLQAKKKSDALSLAAKSVGEEYGSPPWLPSTKESPQKALSHELIDSNDVQVRLSLVLHSWSFLTVFPHISGSRLSPST